MRRRRREELETKTLIDIAVDENVLPDRRWPYAKYGRKKVPAPPNLPARICPVAPDAAADRRPSDRTGRLDAVG